MELWISAGGFRPGLLIFKKPCDHDYPCRRPYSFNNANTISLDYYVYPGCFEFAREITCVCLLTGFHLNK